MFRAFFALGSLVVALAALTARADLMLSRVHVVDYMPHSKALLFRGNQPVISGPGKNNDTFAYTELVSYLTTTAQDEANVVLPPAERLYIVDITLENPEDHGFAQEAAFWATNQNKGAYVQWLLLGAPVWATAFTPEQQLQYIVSGKIFGIDQLPDRVVKLRAMLEAGPPEGYDALAVYVHCAAGCDRTGELIASYRLAYWHSVSLSDVYVRNIAECGRSPDYYSTGMLGWYCLSWNYFNASATLPAVSDCLTAYNCTKYGPCNATWQ